MLLGTVMIVAGWWLRWPISSATTNETRSGPNSGSPQARPVPKPDIDWQAWSVRLPHQQSQDGAAYVEHDSAPRDEARMARSFGHRASLCALRDGFDGPQPRRAAAQRRPEAERRPAP